MNKNKVKLSLLLFLFITFLFSSTIFASDVEIILNDLKIQQGEIIKVTLKSNTIDLKPENYNAKFSGNNFSFYESNNNSLETIIAASYWVQPGIHNLKIKENNNYIYHKNIKVLKGNFPESWIKVSEDKEKLVRPDEEDKALQKKLKEDREKVAKARRNSSSHKLYENAFIWPLQGTISTDFGATRYVNGSLQSRHSGIDIAAPTGTIVKATNTGIVTLAANLTVTGNTVIIDHGHNIFSAYAHLNKMNVQNGEKVNKGDKIGEIGSTGFSTGPHLHWTIKVSNIFVNPKVFLD
ncbi:MAG TPA: M23 family metallopeptidase [Halanaerobiales bacterium]|nr:M23 family metallopeptidase [Halanaerobiales bacterium]